MSKRIRSRYITEVVFENSYIELIDSNGASYYMDIAAAKENSSFKNWFNNIFSKGIPQQLVVFEYERKEHDGQIDLIITKFINV